jgi:para-aminobenzoate synthetase/4-amino-4-deoxychorismate lyase
MQLWHSLPDQVFKRIENAPASVLLHNAAPRPESPFSRLFADPLHLLMCHDLADLPALFAAIEAEVAAGRFVAGYFAYECGEAFEPSAGPLPRLPERPLAWFGVYARCHLFDHRTGAFCGDLPPGFLPEDRASANPRKMPPLSAASFPAPRYNQDIEAIHGWIERGDVYQLNYTIPLALETSASPSQLYASLIRRQPVEYAAFLHTDPDCFALSFSPELFFCLEEGEARRITTRPMKGTIARGRFTAEDQAQAAALRSDAKNRAENLMIVDLLRNDLGRLCRFGSVKTEALFAVERHPTLWQMTSTVRGELRGGVNYASLFRALFPCGSITGAPKVRAMQLIAALEQRPRGIYTGAIGYFSPGQTVFNVAIRTLELQRRPDRLVGVMGVGGGIVADSVAASEWRECALKAEFLTHSGDAREEDFQLLETMLWQEGFPRLEMHLDRLLDSAQFLDFAADRAGLRQSILRHAEGFADSRPRKLRLLLDREGAVRFADELLDPATLGPEARPLRLCLARERTDSANRLYFHKTTRRPLYTRHLAAARAAGYDDLLFFNQASQATESAIANLFVELEGRWWTPPVACGLLPGVERRYLLETRSLAGERILTREDLKRAPAIYLANAVRGLRRATLDWVEL